MVIQSLDELLSHKKERVISLQGLLTSIPAIGPENGGQGEMEKASLVESLLPGSPDVIRLDSPDPRVESGSRPNIIAVYPGKSSRKLWLFAHMDVVPPGELSSWQGNPWATRVCGDRIYGRGVEDNQQALASMLILAEVVCELGIGHGPGLGLVFMADEENGSRHGLQWILEQGADIFAAEDIYLVPDGGSPDADLIEVAEKGQLWLKFSVKGRQCHASAPQAGSNAFLAASRLVCALDDLNREFNDQDALFLPPFSTFVPTRHEPNVDAINILPGRDVFFMDCRLLPSVSQEAVLRRVRAICADIASICDVTVEAEVAHSQQATSVSTDSAAISRLAAAIKTVYGVDARPCGIGGATVASFLRKKGLPALVWACLANTCHQPDEYSSIAATINDARVFGRLLLEK